MLIHRSFRNIVFLKMFIQTHQFQPVQCGAGSIKLSIIVTHNVIVLGIIENEVNDCGIMYMTENNDDQCLG